MNSVFDEFINRRKQDANPVNQNFVMRYAVNFSQWRCIKCSPQEPRALIKQDYAIGKKRVVRLMKELNLVGWVVRVTH
jgi:hypothetical protein